MPATQTQYFAFGGGLDVVTPALSVKPGRALNMVNFEPWFNGGYRRIDGFERFDGRPRPSEQAFVGFDVTSVEDVVIGATITGAISGATGKVIGVNEDDGTFGVDSLAVTKVTGTFVIDEDIGVAATNVDNLLKPTLLNTSGSPLVSGLVTDIDEGVDFAESATGLFCEGDVPTLLFAKDDWSASTLTVDLDDLDASITSVNTWTLRVTARVMRTGPESDDTIDYLIGYAPGPDLGTVTFDQNDVGNGWITREITVVSGATPAQINAADVGVIIGTFTQNGNAADGLQLEVDAIDVIVDGDGLSTIRSEPVVRYAQTVALEDQFILAAQDDYRVDIAVVPGSGPVRGAWQRNAVNYAVRDNVGVTAGILHIGSAAGWTTAGVTMGLTLFFTLGGGGGANPLPLEGATITGTISGATAVVHRIILHAGSTAGNDASGYMVLTGQVGVFVAETIESPAATLVATIAGDSAAFAFPVGGTYRFLNHNFFGGSGSYRTYGVNGVGAGFEIDETNIVSPILLAANPLTGQPAANMPFLLEEHRNYLWLAFPGGSLQHTVIGEPLVMNGFLGAAEFGIGDEITGLNSVVGSVLSITTEREARGMFGKDDSDFELRLIGEKTGGKLYSTQKLDTVYALDDLGVTSLARTDAFGDFVGATVSQLVQPIIDLLRENITDSTIVRRSNQYRVYFNDSTALIMYVPATGSASRARGINTRLNVEFGALTYPFTVDRIYNSEDETGRERSYFCTDTVANEGFVYEDQIGNNFDGDDIRSFVRTVFNQVGSPSYRKRFRRADLELQASRPLALQFIHDLSFGQSQVSGDVTTIQLQAGGGFWDSDNWDEFFWDGDNVSTARAGLNGTGENISLLMFNESAVTAPFILQGVTIHYDLRRLQR